MYNMNIFIERVCEYSTSYSSCHSTNIVGSMVTTPFSDEYWCLNIIAIIMNISKGLVLLYPFIINSILKRITIERKLIEGTDVVK